MTSCYKKNKLNAIPGHFIIRNQEHYGTGYLY